MCEPRWRCTPLQLRQHSVQVTENLTTFFNKGGRHQVKMGGEYLYQLGRVFYYQFGWGELVANGGPIPRNIESLFPVWNDPSTWNLAALSPISLTWRQSIPRSSCLYCRDTYDYWDPQHNMSAWLQDDWTVTKNLTLNLGLRWDYPKGAHAEGLKFEPFLSGNRRNSLTNFGPRVGFAYSLSDKMVVRGGTGKYFVQLADRSTHVTQSTINLAAPATPNDGRPNFAADPFNGKKPTYEQAVLLRNDLADAVASEEYTTPHSYQTSFGVQRQIGASSSFSSDFVHIAGRNLLFQYPNVNVTCNTATGLPLPFDNVSTRPYPNFGLVPVVTTADRSQSNYYALQSAFTKRFSRRWQLGATYTLGLDKDQLGVGNPCDLLDINAYHDRQYSYSADDQRHRVVVNGLVVLPGDVQLSGVYFYGSGQKYAQSVGGDPLRCQCGDGRLAAEGTYVPRNALQELPLHRVDMRISRKFFITRDVSIQGQLEVYNAFNHANYGGYNGFVTSPAYKQPTANTDLAYAPRMLQLGFRLGFGGR